VTLRSLDDLPGAEPLLQEAVGIYRQHWTKQPARLEPFLSELAETLALQHKFAEAEPVIREMRASLAARLPAEDDRIMAVTVSLAHTLTDWAWAERRQASTATVGRPAPAENAREAERVLRDCLTVRTRTLGTNSTRVADTRSLLGGALVAVGVTDSSLDTKSRLTRFEEAESLLLESLPVLQASRNAGPAPRRETLDRLVRLYEAWDGLAPGSGKADQATRWKQALAAFQKSAGERQPKTSDAGGDGQPGKE